MESEWLALIFRVDFHRFSGAFDLKICPTALFSKIAHCIVDLKINKQ
jgi:hypothetical protein